MCRFCGWEGTGATRDAHGSLFCPKCGKPAEYRFVVEELKRQGLWQG